MADLKKELRLVATLDDSAFKRQIESLKKSLGKEFSFDAQSLSGIRDVFKDIAKDFSKELKEALKNVSIGTGRMGGGGGGSPSNDPFIADAKHRAKEYKQEISQQDKLFDREQREKAKSFDKEKQMAQRQQEKEDRNKAKEFQSEQKAKERILMKTASEGDKERKRDTDAARSRFEELKKKRIEERMESSRLDSSLTAKTLRGIGVNGGTARDAAGGVEGLYNNTLGRLSPGMRMAGGLGAAMMLPGMVMSDMRDIRGMQAHRNFALSSSLTQGDILGGAVEQTGRNSMGTMLAGGLQGAAGGALKYGAAGAALGAGVGSLFGGVGAVPGALLGGIGGGLYGLASGGIKGAFTSAEDEAKTRRKETQPILDAVARAQGIAPSRLSMMRGGGMDTRGLNILGEAGGMAGFSPEETMQQALQAKGNLGNKNMFLMSQMQNTMNATGADVGLQASSAETFAGSGRTSIAAGAQKTIDVLKKGVAAGLDVSKSGQFLKLTADYIQSTTGFGKVDTDTISDRLANSMQGFAGGGEVTGTAMEQARALQDMLRTESTSTNGIAGLGNISGIQDAFGQAGQKLDTGTMLALMNSSTNASQDDIKSILAKGGVSPDMVDSLSKTLMENKTNAANMGAGLTGASGNMSDYLLSQSRGITTEQQLGINAAQGFQGTKMNADQLIGGAATQVTSQVEYQKAAADAAVSQKQINAGLDEFGRITKLTTEGLTDFSKALAKASGALNDYLGSPNVKRSSK